jgi:hypothetical protein
MGGESRKALVVVVVLFWVRRRLPEPVEDELELELRVEEGRRPRARFMASFGRNMGLCIVNQRRTEDLNWVCIYM